MTARGAIEILKNAAWLGTNTDREQVEEAVHVAIAALEKEVWKEEHPVSPLQLQLKKHSNQPTKDNSCIYCNNRMSCGEYLEWLYNPDALLVPRVNGCPNFNNNKN